MQRACLTIRSTEASKVLNADQINAVLDALHQALKERLPRLREPAVESVEGFGGKGTYGSIAFGILLFGGVEAQITILLEWETARKLSSKLLGVPKLEFFSEDAQLVLEETMQSASDFIKRKLSAYVPEKIETATFPTCVEGNILLSHYPETEIVKVTIQTLWDPITLFVACPKPPSTIVLPTEEAPHAA